MNYRRALVVDDSKVARLTLKKKLELQGVTVDLADSARQALDYLRENRPDIIFMDHLMPEMDGFQATRQIKSDPATREIPVIICSGKEDPDYVEQARSMGAAHAIAKPPGTGVLEAILKSVPGAPAPVAELAASAAAQPAKPREAAAAQALDPAAVHALVERMLGEYMEHLRSELSAELAESQDRRIESTIGARLDSLAGRLDALERAAPQARAPDIESMTATVDACIAPRLAELATRLHGEIEQHAAAARIAGLEERLHAVEALASAGSRPDPSSITESVERQLGTRVDQLRREFEQRLEAADPRLEALRAELAQQAQSQRSAIDQAQSGVEHRLEELSERLASLSASLAAADSRQAQQAERYSARLDAMEQAVADVDVIHSAIDARVMPRLDEFQAVLRRQESQIETLREESRAGIAELRTQSEQALERLVARADSLSEELSQLSDATLSSDASHDQRFELMQQRLAALEAVEPPAPAPDLDTLVAAVDQRIGPRLAEVQVQLQTQLEDQSPTPLVEALRERLSAQLQEQREELRAEIEAQRAQVQAMEKLRDTLEAELAGQREQLTARLDQERERLLERIDEERAQRSSGLDAQQARIETQNEDWAQRFDDLQQRVGQLADAGIDEGVSRILERRIAQMREAVSAVLQPEYPGGPSWPAAVREGEVFEHAVPAVVPAPLAEEGPGAALLRSIEAKIGALSGQLSEAQQRITDAVGAVRPAIDVGGEREERIAARIGETWNERLRAEVARLEGKVKTLTATLIVGGGALAAAIAAVAWLR